jgi:hypothetical protein
MSRTKVISELLTEAETIKNSTLPLHIKKEKIEKILFEIAQDGYKKELVETFCALLCSKIRKDSDYINEALTELTAQVDLSDIIDLVYERGVLRELRNI